MQSLQMSFTSCVGAALTTCYYIHTKDHSGSRKAYLEQVLEGNVILLFMMQKSWHTLEMLLTFHAFSHPYKCPLGVAVDFIEKPQNIND